MPLESISETAPEETDTHSLTFVMRELETGKHINVVVDGIALEDLAVIDNTEHADLISLFLLYRSRIEEIASNKYMQDD